MPIDPQARMLLDAMAQQNAPDITTLPPAEAKAQSAARSRFLPPGPEALVRELEIPGPSGAMAARAYRPLGSDRQALPVVVYFHGGGFVLGDLMQSDADCRRLCTGASCAVVSVDYPLAPEHRFPEPPAACYAAVEWVHAQASALGFDAKRLAVAGDSAGGNLAAVVSLLARDRGGPPIAFQLLIYPVTDLSRFDRPSHLENAEGYFLTRAQIQWFASHYLRSAHDGRHEHVSPLLAADLAGLPPALVITAELDPLRDEGEAFAQRLERAGVPITLSRYSGMIHGFFTMSPYLDAGKRATEEAVQALRAALA